jgi:hypothetical protein
MKRARFIIIEGADGSSQKPTETYLNHDGKSSMSFFIVYSRKKLKKRKVGSTQRRNQLCGLGLVSW